MKYRWWIGGATVALGLLGVGGFVLSLKTADPPQVAQEQSTQVEVPVASKSEPGKIRIFVRIPTVNKPFKVSAYIKGYRPEDKIRIILPPELNLVEGQTAQLLIPPPGESGLAKVEWMVKCHNAGDYTVRAEVPNIDQASELIHVNGVGRGFPD